MLFQTPIRFKLTTGEATLDFGTGNKTAEVVVTGVSNIQLTSIVYPNVKIEATTEHATDDFLVDPIRLAYKDVVAGTGFTIYGEMDNARANGRYTIQWSFS
tara:strand:- start:2273 stop:2575 length:303 start_codon:yes stop_codon:yes gene_type:complete